MNRIFERAGVIESEKSEKIRERIKVGILGCGGCAGATFTATALALQAARTASRRIAFVQAEENTQKTNIYDALGMDKRFAGREFFDFYAMLSQGERIKDVRNMDENINWALRVPANSVSYDVNSPLSRDLYNAALQKYSEADIPPMPDAGVSGDSAYLHAAHLINNISCDFAVCDFGSGSPKNPLYRDMDTLICVLDPLPSKLLAASALIEEMKIMQSKGHNVIWLINKENGGINRRELRDFLGSGVLLGAKTIPLIDEKHFYSAEYNCEIPFARKEIREKTKEVFTDILQKILN